MSTATRASGEHPQRYRCRGGPARPPPAVAARPARGRPPVPLGGSRAGRGQRRRRFRPPFYAAERPEAEVVLRLEGFGPVWVVAVWVLRCSFSLRSRGRGGGGCDPLWLRFPEHQQGMGSFSSRGKFGPGR